LCFFNATRIINDQQEKRKKEMKPDALNNPKDVAN